MRGHQLVPESPLIESRWRRLAILVALLIAALRPTGAGAQEFPALGGSFVAGLHSNFLNFGLGPSLEYWPTNQVGVTVSYGVLGDLETYGARLMYLFDRDLQVFSVTRPYVGLGFSKAEEDDAVSLAPGVAGTIKVEGDGAELFAGIRHARLFGVESLFWDIEAIYSTIDLRGEAEVCGFGTCARASSEGDYSNFSLGTKLVFRFGR